MTHTGTGLGNPRWPDRRTLAHRRLARKTIIPHQPRDGTDPHFYQLLVSPGELAEGVGRRGRGWGLRRAVARKRPPRATRNWYLPTTQRRRSPARRGVLRTSHSTAPVREGTQRESGRPGGRRRGWRAGGSPRSWQSWPITGTHRAASNRRRAHPRTEGARAAASL